MPKNEIVCIFFEIETNKQQQPFYQRLFQPYLERYRNVNSFIECAETRPYLSAINLNYIHKTPVIFQQICIQFSVRVL